MYENTDNVDNFDPAQVVASAADDWGEPLETYSEVSTVQAVDSEMLADIRNDISTIKDISLLIFVAILLVFIFRFLFGQLASWFSC